MSSQTKLHRPWMVAVWPGMGHVAISAGYYLMAKLGMHVLTEFTDEGLFDVEHVEVKDGLIQTGRWPRSRLFIWNDPQQRHDLVIFIGEAQPNLGKYAFCRKVIEHAKELGVERVFTFAAMATQMRPEDDCRVFGAAADKESLEELRRLELEILEDGQISGLNGLLLGVAGEYGLGGACLLGEMPHVFVQLPFPKASLAVLEVFTTLTRIELDFSELAEQARSSQEELGEFLANVERSLTQQSAEESEGSLISPSSVEPEQLAPEDQRRVEVLFQQAKQDRSKAYALKQELDRLEVFQDYEDRFLDLFKKTDD